MKQFDDEMKEPGESGMSLIEVMVSLTMLGVVLVVLGQGLTLGIRMNTDSKARVSSLNLCKQLTEKMKSKIQFSQAVFDTANDNAAFARTFYADSNGEEILTTQQTPGTPAPGTIPGTGGSVETAPPDASYRVTVEVDDWANEDGDTLSATDANGLSHVLVKTLSVKVVALQTAVGVLKSDDTSSREVSLSVEMVRPAA